MITISVDKIMLLFFVISWIIIHLGMNPDSGGSPPIDSRAARVRVVIIGIVSYVG